MRDWGRTEYRVVPNWTPRDVREARPSAPLPHLSSAAASLTRKSLRKQAPPLLQHTSPDQHSRPSRAAESEEEEEEGMVANEQGYPPQLASNAGDTDASSQVDEIVCLDVIHMYMLYIHDFNMCSVYTISSASTSVEPKPANFK